MSILGPIMFQIYVNDLPRYISDCRISMFADDTAIYEAADTITELEIMMQDDLQSLRQWLIYNN